MDDGDRRLVSYLAADGEWCDLPEREMDGRDVVYIPPDIWVDGRLFRALQRRAGVVRYLRWAIADHIGLN